jgi:hypothetical protein
MLTYADVCCLQQSDVALDALVDDRDQVGEYKSTTTDAAAGTNAQILTLALGCQGLDTGSQQLWGRGLEDTVVEDGGFELHAPNGSTCVKAAPFFIQESQVLLSLLVFLVQKYTY